MSDVNLEFLSRQLASILEGQRQMSARLTEIEARLPATATRDLLLRVLRSFEGQAETANLRIQLLRETLEARIKAAETRLDALERV